MHEINITVARFGPYPTDEPVSYVVGFTATNTPTGRSIYRDCCIPFTDLGETHTDDDVVAAGWHLVKDSVDAWSSTCNRKSPIIGSVFTVPSEISEPVHPTDPVHESPEDPVHESLEDPVPEV